MINRNNIAKLLALNFDIDHEAIAITPHSNNNCKEENLNSILTSVLQKQINKGNNFASTLSGGLDSSYISSLCAKILEKRNKKLTCFSNVEKEAIKLPKSKSEYADTKTLVNDVANYQRNIEVNLITHDMFPVGFEKIAAFCFKYGQMPLINPINFEWMLAFCHYAHKKNIDTMFCADFGNATISWKGQNQNIICFSYILT